MSTRASQPKTIAIDFDDTFTADDILFAGFVYLAQQRGHKVIMVTARPRDEINKKAVFDFLEKCGIDIPVSFTDRTSKLRYMEELGTRVDIWIDDNPHALVHGH